MDPAAVPDALVLGKHQAGEDAAVIRDLWRD